jgi:hypothetical protein
MSASCRTPISLVGLCCVLVACSLDVTPTPYSGIWVHGVVFNEAGAGVGGVQIRIGYRPMAECSTAGFSAPAIAPSTDSTGAYGVGVVDTGAPHDVCVKIVATPPVNHSLAAESVLVAGVTLTEGPLADSVRIDLVLPPGVAARTAFVTRPNRGASESGLPRH